MATNRKPKNASNTLCTSQPVSRWIGEGDELTAIDQLSRATRREYVAAGKYPAPVKLGGLHIRWLREEVEAWVRDRIENHRVTWAPRKARRTEAADLGA
ncbi:hypothetical protein OF001_U20354 [Pseudomonas sp. OF001]|uniref:helix-turn-helix transcriptional regulator n=1 Tax=Pseudomonas sp. OF001 TaxID=2772300 RepID=UPI001918B341|nr:AlpA family phage regulatory protein [Pseudomonas sp. OF001]CAD5377427.1 hypothetical protein OF001_U20354 [Pseudomonas sp. OF001]